MINSIKYIKIAVVVTAVISFSLIVKNHYENLLGTIEQLQLTNQQLSIAIKSRDEVNRALSLSIEEWKTTQDEYMNSIKELHKVSINSQRQMRKINDIFSKHKLDKLAINKPGLIENRVNNGTSSIMRMLECSSGSKNSSCNSSNTE